MRAPLASWRLHIREECRESKLFEAVKCFEGKVDGGTCTSLLLENHVGVIDGLVAPAKLARVIGTPGYGVAVFPSSGASSPLGRDRFFCFSSIFILYLFFICIVSCFCSFFFFVFFSFFIFIFVVFLVRSLFRNEYPIDSAFYDGRYVEDRIQFRSD